MGRNISNNHLGRVLGFVAFSSDLFGHSQQRIISALDDVASVFDLRVHLYNLPNIKIGVISRFPINFGMSKNCESMSFVVSSATSESIDNDRFLKVIFNGNSLTCESDYAGTVPYYYSRTGPLVISSFISVVEAGLGVSESDIDLAALFAFVRFGHNIWDETVWNQIRAGTPSSKLTFSVDAPQHPINLLQKSTISVGDFEDKFVRSKSLSNLRELNSGLIKDSLSGSEQIILPLSSGLDSRLVLAGISDDQNLKRNTLAVTYGPANSIEVKSAKRLAEESGVKWVHLDLPLDFLSERYLSETSLVFGSSLHMHAMYQLEFLEEMKRRRLVDEGAVFTSGFMTGVPSGQHISKLGRWRSKLDAEAFLDSFSQSRYWSVKELSQVFGRHSSLGFDLVSQKLDLVPVVYPNNPYKQSILVDIWTRQRNFISYHPRTLELRHPVASPHMRVEWVSFFLRQPNSWLWKRRLVQEFFLDYYPNLAAVPTNSENFSRLGTPLQSIGRIAYILLERIGLAKSIPERFSDQQFRFDEIALSKTLPNSLAPLPSFLPNRIDDEPILETVQELIRSQGADMSAYGKLVAFQAVSRSLERTFSQKL